MSELKHKFELAELTLEQEITPGGDSYLVCLYPTKFPRRFAINSSIRAADDLVTVVLSRDEALSSRGAHVSQRKASRHLEKLAWRVRGVLLRRIRKLLAGSHKASPATIARVAELFSEVMP